MLGRTLAGTSIDTYMEIFCTLDKRAFQRNKGYIQAISSGKALPSMAQFLRICDYFEMTPLQFFDSEAVNPQLLHRAMEGMRKLSEDDLIMLIGFINRLQSEK